MIGRTIRRAREAKGWSQQELADSAGLSRRHISQIERGRTNASYEALSKIARALDLDAIHFDAASANVVERIDRTIAELSAVRDVVASRERVAPAAPMPPENDPRHAELRRLLNALPSEARQPLYQLLTEPLHDTAAAVPLGPGYRVLLAVRQLLESARSIDESSPSRALQFADLALDTIGTLQDERLAFAKTHLSALCWRERAYYAVQNGREVEALAAADRAEALFHSLGAFEYDVANVWMTRAGSYGKLNRYDESVETVRRAARVFESFKDDEQLLKCRIIEAMTLQAARQYGAAMQIWAECEAPAKTAVDAELLPLVYNGLGICYRNVGRLDDSEAAYRHAAELYGRIGVATRVTQAEWGLALTIAAKGERERALSMLRDAHDDFERFGMTTMAIGTMLDIVQLKLDAGEREGIADICRDLVDRSARAQRSEAALTALAYLKEAAQNDRLSQKMVVHVREYLCRLERRAEAFVPLPD